MVRFTSLLRAPFAWRSVSILGVWDYQENGITGARRAVRAMEGGWQPKDQIWLSGATDKPPGYWPGKHADAARAIFAEMPTGVPVPILYRNWRGEVARRRIALDVIAYGNEATSLRFGSTEWHPETQWLLSATDVDKGVRRVFAMSGILAWGQEAIDAALAAVAAEEQVARERDAAIKVGEMAATSGAFWARRAESAEARLTRIETHADAQSRAQTFATRAHADQKDKAGRPYTGHLVRVAARAYAHAEARGLGPEIAGLCVQADWLHDTVEDTATTLLELTAEGFDLRVVGAVERLTRPCGVPYLDWIRAIIASGDTVAMIVKLADNEDNADPARSAVYPISTRLLDRYEQSAALLREALS